MDSASGSHGDDSRGEESCGSGSFVELLRAGVVVVLISFEASPLGVACGEATVAGGGSLTMVGE